MVSTTHPNWNEKTEGLEVAAAFPEAIKGKNVLVTGVNKGGIGYTTAQAFASQAPSHLILAGRNQSKLQECVDAIKVDYPNVDVRTLIVDLSSQKSAREAAKTFLADSDVPQLDILVNSAGIMNIPERKLTEEGIELHFATNHIGHFLFTNGIMPKILKAAESNPKGSTRIVNVSSGATEAGGIRWADPTFAKLNKDLPEEEKPDAVRLAHFGVEGSDEKSYIPIVAYVQSKAANTLFSLELTKRLYEKKGIFSIAVHPGVIQTEVSDFLPLRNYALADPSPARQIDDSGNVGPTPEDDGIRHAGMEDAWSRCCNKSCCGN
jgi:NAD(P)-dependent dehydrogenase (short-subunit alcohol dehydrogenase family)